MGASQWNLDINARSTGVRESTGDLLAYRAALVEGQQALEQFHAARGRGETEAPRREGAAFSKTEYTDPIASSPWEKLKGWKGGELPGADTKKASEAIQKDARKSSASVAKLGKELGGVSGILRAGVMAAAAYAGVTGAASLTKLAIGYQGVARLQAISYRASLDMRALFTGVDASPLLRATDRFEKNLSRSTVTGNALSGLLTRSFNGFFKLVEKGEPYLTAIAQGALIAGLYVENGFLRARIALLPYTDALQDVIGEQDALETAAYAGGIAVAAAGAYAAAAVAPYVLLAVAVGAVAAAFQQAARAYSELKEMGGSRFVGQLQHDVGLMGDQEYQEKVLGIKQGREKARKVTNGVSNSQNLRFLIPGPGGGGLLAAYDAVTKGADDKGTDTGKQLGQGLVQGMGLTEAAVRAAGGSLADAANKGVRDKAEIHSPSLMMEENARLMGQGAVRGFERSAPEVSDAASRALVPDLSGVVGRGANAGAGGGPVQVTIAASFPNVHSGNAGDISAALEDAVPFLTAIIARNLRLQTAVPNG